VISFQDLFGTLGGQTLNLSERPVECMILVMLIYLTISLTVSGLMNIYNNAIKLVER
jgi:general L-amino acid transport system permease protein